MSTPGFRRALATGRWESIEVHEYKPAGSAPFRGVSRQRLFSQPGLACEWRYFEVAAGGHTTLERHQHEHAVMILDGHGACLAGGQVRAVGPRDLVSIGALQWHQFRASEGEALGFLCLVNAARDRPQLPDTGQLEALREDPVVAAFIRL